MTPVTLLAGSVPHLSSRYGDYFGAATDPSDPSVVWVAGEYNKTMPNGRWATYIGAITVSAGLAPNGIAPPIRSNLLGRTTGGDLGSPSTPPVAVGLSAPAMRTVAPRRPHGSLT